MDNEKILSAKVLKLVRFTIMALCLGVILSVVAYTVGLIQGVLDVIK